MEEGYFMFERLVSEVVEIDNELTPACKNNDVINSLFLGTQIFFSPIIEKPEIMFLGINPGDGYDGQKKDNGKWLNVAPMNEGLHYIEYGCKLGNSIIELFKDINKYYLLEEESFKTNCYFFATKQTKCLKALFKALPVKLENKLHEYSKKWTQEIIETINPWMIFCEGKFAFQHLQHLQHLQHIYGDKFEIHSNEYNILEAECEKRTIFSFARRYSSFKDKQACVKRLRKYIEDNNI
jgi:hypothetical protein